MTLAIIGGGAMGEAVIEAVLRSGFMAAGDIQVAEVSDERRDHLGARYRAQTFAAPQLAADGASLVLLAVKPQDATTALAPLRGLLGGATTISIMAGVTLDRLRELLETNAIVRAMPNTPAQIGEGMTVWTATESVAAATRETIARLFASLGDEAFVSEERQLDMATALSGSGPAYVFLFMEALIDAGVHLGLAPELASKMAQKTVLGSALYAQKSTASLAELRERVTSPGGTTAAALQTLDKAGFRSIIQAALEAAFNRSVELGRKD